MSGEHLPSTQAAGGFAREEHADLPLFRPEALAVANGGMGRPIAVLPMSWGLIGAMLGALVMQSLQSGMVLVGIDTPFQRIVVGMVLVVAVWLDTIYRARAK